MLVLVKPLASLRLLPTSIFGRGSGPMTGDAGGVVGRLQVWCRLGDGWTVRTRDFPQAGVVVVHSSRSSFFVGLFGTLSADAKAWKNADAKGWMCIAIVIVG